jgi:thiol-disulfide isomerase/thioredoxin
MTHTLLRRRGIFLLLLAPMCVSAPRAFTPAPGGTVRIMLDKRAFDPRDPGNGDFLDCPDKAAGCSAVLLPRVEPDEKVVLPRNKSKDDLRYLSLKGFRARGGDPLGTVALFPARGGDSVFFDDNNDEDLGNDGHGRFWPKGDSCVTVEPRSVAAPFSLCRAGGKAKEWQARCESLKSSLTWALCDDAPYRLKVMDIAYGFLGGGAGRKIGMADLDGDGKFHLHAGDRLLVDWNGDGVLEKSIDGDGMPALQEKSFAFTLDSATYEVAAFDEGGAWIDLRRVAYEPAAVIFKAVEGRHAPDLRFVNLDGDTMSLSDFHGKKVLLNFWSVLCKPCLDQFPSIAQFNAQFASKNWQVISLTTDRELDLVQQAAMKYHVNWMIGMVGPEARGYYNNRPLPLNVKIDAQGILEKKDVPLGKHPPF